MDLKNVETIYNLSPVQEALLRRDLEAEAAGGSCRQADFELREDLDAAAFERAWQKAVERHALLRTAFYWKRLKAPVQVVRHAQNFSLAKHDWRGLSAAEQEERAREILREDRERGFDPSAPPLMRVSLCRTGARSHRLIWSVHPLLLDERSLPLLLREVLALYEGLRGGSDARPAGGRRYGDYIGWLKRQDASGAELFWREMFAGFDAGGEQFFARAHRGLPGEDEHAQRQLALPRELTRALESRALGLRVSLGCVVQGAWALLMGRYAGRDEAVFGVTVTHSPAELDGADSMVGPLTNTLPLRVQLPPDAPVGEWLRGLHEREEGLRRYGYVTLEQAREWAGAPAGSLRLESNVVLGDGLEGRPWRPTDGRFDLLRRCGLGRPPHELTLAPRLDSELTLQLTYDRRRFDDEAAATILSHLRTLLEALAAGDARRLGDLSVVSDAERAELLRDVARANPADETPVHRIFESQAARRPGATALVFGGESLSYGELNARANRLAHRLRALGVGDGSPVGVCVERSPELVVGLLAVWKAGGAYVPLDPAYPAERLAFMLEDSGARVLLTQGTLAGLLPAHDAAVVRLDADRPSVEAESSADPACAFAADQPAYLIYTSGTTGRPKGVVVEHRNLSTTLRATQAEFGFTADDRMPCIAAYSFDIFLFELLSPLLAGGVSLLMTREQTLEPGVLVRELESATALHTLPALMRQIVNAVSDEGRGDRHGGLRVLFVGGDVVAPDLLRDMRRAFPCARVHVLYGPTEATIVCTSYGVPAGREVKKYLIGRPLGDALVRLYDADGRPTPKGLAGEICVAGGGVTRGYLRRPELTEEKYVVLDGRRFYRTGDEGRLTAEGDLEFLGRRDQQVKVRGFRVELGEVESALCAHEGVKEAVVVARAGAGGEKRLVAYVVAAEGALKAGELREHVGARLPDYMVPSAFVVLGELPLSSNGKVDRRALPEPESAPSKAGEYAAPRTPAEELVAGVWAEVLGVERVGINENFFELGGHSLLATQVVSRVREALGVEVPLRALFESPTVEGLAAEALAASARGPAAPPITRVERGQELPLSFAQRRLWFLDQLEPGSPVYNVPLAVRMGGRLDVAALRQTLSEIVRRHESLRTVFRVEAGEPVQVIQPAAPVKLEVIDLSALPAVERDAEARRLAGEEARRPFDLAAGPLLRASLLRLSEEEHVVLFTMHHIVSDGWSMGVLVNEVAALYAAFTRGEASPLPELEIQYADYASWQRGWLKGEVLEEQLSYWRRQLEGAPAVIELPTDRPRSAAQGFNGATQTFSLSPELSHALRELSRKEGATLFMTLLAGFQLLLARYSGRDDIVVGTDIANRNRAETESLIGFFVNQLVLRTRLDDDLTFRGLLGRVRAVTLGAYAHQDVPFDRLVEELRPERGAGNTPLFQVKLVLQNTPGGALELPGLTLSALEGAAATGTAKFDLMLTLMDGGEGLAGSLSYSTELFEPATVTLLVERFRTLLGSAAASPDARLGSLEWLTEDETRRRATQKKKREQLNLEKFKSLKPKSVNLSRERLVKAGPLREGGSLPLVVRPNVEGLDLAEWARGNAEFIERNLLTHGGLLFRGFAVGGQRDFESFLASVTTRLMRYMEGATPRKELGEKVYTSTEYPADQHIALHNELTYVTTWPMKVWFYCEQPAAVRGETPVADVRRVYDRIDPRVRARFEEKGWMLVRNFGDGLSLPWQTSFHTTSEAEVEEYGRRNRVEVEWKPCGGLRTRQVRPAVARHPQTGEPVWFNHVAFWHVSSLEAKVRESLLTVFGDERELPYNTYYGDGARIEDSVVEHIRAAYAAERVEFPWERGDVLMLDNMLAAHGRSPFEGARRVIVAMGEGFDSTARAGSETETH